MTSQLPNKVDVLVIGAGTTGLTVAVSMLSQGRGEWSTAATYHGP
jgi:2-polyprenyl-6-methoxyphenol hydroxylase-like FAD-dependent oxidoreductase